MALQNTLLILSIATSVLGLAALFVKMGSQFGSLRSDLDGFETETLRRFDGVDRRFDRVDLRLDRVEDRLDRVEDRVAGMAVDLARIGQKLDDHVLDPRGHQAA